MSSLIVLLCDQLSLDISSLQNIKDSDTVLMHEGVYDSLPHHPKKLCLWFASMRHFAQELSVRGINVIYINFDANNRRSLTEEIISVSEKVRFNKVIVTSPNDYDMRNMMLSWPSILKMPVELLEDNRFLCSVDEFKNWMLGRKQLRMEYFYRYMRVKYNILMDNGNPVGGVWNYDQDNRKPPQALSCFPKRLKHKKSRILIEVLSLVKNSFGHHFGQLEPFFYAVTRSQALLELDHFIEHVLPMFGDYQDAMLTGEAYIYHSLLSSYINLGLLLPLEICKKAEQAYRLSRAPINAVEGFIRQILGWREFVRAVYWLKMPEYKDMNYLNATRSLPNFYWNAKTNMLCISEVVSQTKIHAYSHHIQRLMVTGNFALLAGLDVKEVQNWYLAVYSDAYEWVEMPNTLGMSLFGDGGILASKPYASSGQYINKMSNFCKQCRYNVKEVLGVDACPFNSLYWRFLHINREKLSKNNRLALAYKSWDRFDHEKQALILQKSESLLRKLDDGEL